MNVWFITCNGATVAVRDTLFGARNQMQVLKMAGFADWVKKYELRGDQDDLNTYISLNSWDVAGPLPVEQEITASGDLGGDWVKGTAVLGDN